MGLYHSISLEKPEVRGQQSLWMAHTLASIQSSPTFCASGNPLLGSPFPSLSRYVPSLNESTKDRYSNPIGEPNPKDRPNRWDTPIKRKYHSTSLCGANVGSYQLKPITSWYPIPKLYAIQATPWGLYELVTWGLKITKFNLLVIGKHDGSIIHNACYMWRIK